MKAVALADSRRRLPTRAESAELHPDRRIRLLVNFIVGGLRTAFPRLCTDRTSASPQKKTTSRKDSS
jgi:hypothetical protein